MQVGPIYFATPRKCHVFWMCAEGTGIHRFYMIDESEKVAIVSQVWCTTIFLTLALEKNMQRNVYLRIHFDNAVGQNKNNTILGYCMWRVLTGLHESVSLSMMLPGHTKFTPDWHFGVWKIKWRQSDAECMEDIAYTVKASSRSGHNIPQRVNDPSRPVVFLNWKTFFENYFKL
ncbi:uncharacterized protein LOC127852797 [Dreissena polymorpha]|uniref:DUF7869 domain-containing protein n=1 Tax=Dreissena polymorpha TaxID=45954 RepID=A0A9D4CQ57_DREPO|nr:uncharacterized protein LOC127852797 [Dreissena polymorpha]KAH3728836.1 hypothetical protein DPMN_054798 [Dreissena polymorpha]